jgi:class 3 adenylate cyclase
VPLLLIIGRAEPWGDWGGDQIERKLSTILAADIAGYSRLMASDEEGTLARLKSHRRELIDPKIKEYRGRIIKTTGDGMLVESPAWLMPCDARSISSAAWFRGTRR